MDEQSIVFSKESLAKYVEIVLNQERYRLADKVQAMPFGETAHSFATWLRNGGKSEML